MTESLKVISLKTDKGGLGSSPRWIGKKTNLPSVKPGPEALGVMVI